ncbi:MAG: SMC-Scp complex subunit ScpB [Firmicutes bacterium]|nr:SMC-Scp complex subunit ScpB [Bacillota bacterium]
MYSRKTKKSALESMMFVMGEAIEVKDAASILETSREEIRELFNELKDEYEMEGRGIRIRQLDDSYGFVTNIENDVFIRKLCTPVRIKRLSQAALEVLAIIAYRQPVTRGEIDSIRGIKSERVIEGLYDKGLVEAVGRSEGVGRPVLYGTTKEFLAKFGFSSLDDLPEIEELESDKERSGLELHQQLTLDQDEDYEEVEINED